MNQTARENCILFLVSLVMSILLIPSLAGAVKAPPDHDFTKSTPTLSMGQKPDVRSVSPDSKRPTNAAAGLKKISIRGINQTLDKTKMVPSAVAVAEKIFNGASVGSDNKLTAPTQTASNFSASLKRSTTDNLGFQHVRVTQSYKGIPIFGAEAIVHVNKNNQVYRVTGSYLPDIDVEVAPAISDQDALAMGMNELKDAEDLGVQQQPILVIIQKRLAFHYVLTHKGPQVGQWHYYVDATSGDLIMRYNNIQHVDPTGSGSHVNVSGQRLSGEDGSNVTWQGWLDDNGLYYLISYLTRWAIFDVDAGDWEQLGGPDWTNTDPAAISAGYNLAIVQDYVKTVLGLDSFDNANAFAIANVHEGTDLVNAFWNGSMLFFGDGDGVNAGPLTVLDIAAHEFGHAIIDNTSDLIYQSESGALNEGYADILGALVEFWDQPNGTASYPSSVPGQSDWLLGEDAWLAAEALRNLRDPISYGYPAYYKGTNWHPNNNPSDNFGVHTNSGVIYHAFYLLSEGGSGSNDGHPYNLTGIGLTDAGAVAMRANNVYHTPADGYRQAREAWIDAASDLAVSENMTVAKASIEAVFDAVGVFEFIPPSGGVVNDGSFENGPQPDSDWTQASSSGVELVSDPAPFFNVGAFDGTFAYWAGGYVGGVPDTNSMEQTVTVPSDTEFLEFAAMFIRVAADDTDVDIFSVSINGVEVYSQDMNRANDTFPNYETVKINAAAYAGQSVDLRLEAQSNGSDTGNVLVDYVTFAAAPTPTHTVSFTANSGGQIVGTAAQSVPDGANASPVTAQADSGFTFSGWSGDYSGNENPLTLSNVTSDMTVVANFTGAGTSGGGGSSGGGGGGGGGCFIDMATSLD